MRAEGATPATVGVIEGEVRVGLSSEELDHLARCKSSLKVSRRDLPYVLSKVRHARTHRTHRTSFMAAFERCPVRCFFRGSLGERQCRPR